MANHAFWVFMFTFVNQSLHGVGMATLTKGLMSSIVTLSAGLTTGEGAILKSC